MLANASQPQESSSQSAAPSSSLPLPSWHWTSPPGLLAFRGVVPFVPNASPAPSVGAVVHGGAQHTRPGVIADDRAGAVAVRGGVPGTGLLAGFAISIRASLSA